MPWRQHYVIENSGDRKEMPPLCQAYVKANGVALEGHTHQTSPRGRAFFFIANRTNTASSLLHLAASQTVQ